MHYDVVVIGAGASGVLVAAHLHRLSPALRVTVVDAGARAARGLAYGTPYGAHLLNVPAARMSAFADDPAHFMTWLGEPGKVFAPRRLYGDYLAHVLDAACAPPSRTTRTFGTATGLIRAHDEWEVHLHDARIIRAKTVVLALGNLPPADPLRLGDDAPETYLRDPWAPAAAQGLTADAPILIIGTGLTMIDVVLALRAEGHRGPVHAISRRGLLPHAHAAHLPQTLEPPAAASPRAMLRWVRNAITDDWRAVVDALRPHTARIWQSWTLRQRAAFLRHLRVYWDVHRHRAAPEVAAEVAELIASGALTIHAGRVASIEERKVTCVIRGTTRTFDVARVINCTGPASDYAAVDLPLVAQIRRAGWLVPDPLRLGVETDAEGRLLGADRTPVPGLFTIGPLRRPELWESTAIPEIRAQAAELATRLASADAPSVTIPRHG